jgi:hypothetical protein
MSVLKYCITVVADQCTCHECHLQSFGESPNGLVCLSGQYVAGGDSRVWNAEQRRLKSVLLFKSIGAMMKQVACELLSAGPSLKDCNFIGCKV